MIPWKPFLPLFCISAEPVTIEKLQNISLFPLNKSPLDVMHFFILLLPCFETLLDVLLGKVG